MSLKFTKLNEIDSLKRMIEGDEPDNRVESYYECASCYYGDIIDELDFDGNKLVQCYSHKYNLYNMHPFNKRTPAYIKMARARLEEITTNTKNMESNMKTYHKTIDDIVDNKEECPLPVKIIPDNMGINLCSVDSITWTKQDDGQLVNLTIHFKPAN